MTGYNLQVNFMYAWDTWVYENTTINTDTAFKRVLSKNSARDMASYR